MRLEYRPMKFKLNDRVRVTNGTFKGLVGTVVQCLAEFEGYSVKFDDPSVVPLYIHWYPNELEIAS